eukprot:g73020.t1
MGSWLARSRRALTARSSSGASTGIIKGMGPGGCGLMGDFFFKDDGKMENYMDRVNAFSQRGESSNKRISSCPLLRDPYESQVVEVQRSTIPHGGEGLFARCVLRRGDVCAWYNGIRITHTKVDRRPWKENHSTISLDANTVIDVPEPYDSLKNYYASLGHKTNHCLSRQNAKFDLCFHPRFGDLKCVRAIKTILPGEEIFVDYGYKPGTGPVCSFRGARSEPAELDTSCTPAEKIFKGPLFSGSNWKSSCGATVTARVNCSAPELCVTQAEKIAATWSESSYDLGSYDPSHTNMIAFVLSTDYTVTGNRGSTKNFHIEAAVHPREQGHHLNLTRRSPTPQACHTPSSALYSA